MFCLLRLNLKMYQKNIENYLKNYLIMDFNYDNLC